MKQLRDSYHHFYSFHSLRLFSHFFLLISFFVVCVSNFSSVLVDTASIIFTVVCLQIFVSVYCVSIVRASSAIGEKYSSAIGEKYSWCIAETSLVIIGENIQIALANFSFSSQRELTIHPYASYSSCY